MGRAVPSDLATQGIMSGTLRRPPIVTLVSRGSVGRGIRLDTPTTVGQWTTAWTLSARRVSHHGGRGDTGRAMTTTTAPGLDATRATAFEAAIERHTEEAFQLLERLVEQPSTVGQEQGALEVLGAALEPLGFELERLPIPESVAELPGAGVPARPYAGRYDLVARRHLPGPGDRRPHLLLNGHIDVVPADEPALWTSPPFEPRRVDGWMRGRGAGDMKCGFAMGLLALRALRDVIPDPELPDLTFVAAIEEEYTGNGTLAAAHAGVTADAAILLEPTDLGILLGGVGILWLGIEVVGRAAHAESAATGQNAIELATRLLPGLRAAEDELNGIPDPRIDGPRPFVVNLGRIEGGDWVSSVPSVARLGVRVGYPIGWEPDQAQEVVARHIGIACASDPWLAAHPPTLHRTGFQAEGYDQPATDPLVSTLMAAHREAHGADPRLSVMATTTDARIYRNRLGIPALCYGPRTRDIHGIDEAVELASIIDGARVLGRFLARWTTR